MALGMFNVITALRNANAWLSSTTGGLILVWLSGAIILGIMMIATRGRKMILNQRMLRSRLLIGIIGSIFFGVSFPAWAHDKKDAESARDQLQRRFVENAGGIGRWRIRTGPDFIRAFQYDYRHDTLRKMIFNHRRTLAVDNAKEALDSVLMYDVGRIILSISCQHGKSPEALIVAVEWLPGLPTDSLLGDNHALIKFRFDSLSEETARGRPFGHVSSGLPSDPKAVWSRLGNGTYIRDSAAMEFMQEMLQHERLMMVTNVLQARMDGSDGQRRGTATFYLEGTHEVVRKIGRACNIPETMWLN